MSNYDSVVRNHVILPVHQSYGGDFTIRKIECGTCGKALAALVIADVHEAEMVWPYRVVCEGHQHILVERGAGEDANAVVKGKAAQDWEVKKFLEPYRAYKP
jgi:hypothetical protein